MNKDLPEFLQKFVERYPDIWEQYGQLSQTVGSVEGLDQRSQRLVKLGIAIGAGRQGAVHSHTRKCKKAGLSNAEIFHAALLAITTIGWSGAIAGLAWINDELQDL